MIFHVVHFYYNRQLVKSICMPKLHLNERAGAPVKNTQINHAEPQTAILLY